MFIRDYLIKIDGKVIADGKSITPLQVNFSINQTISTDQDKFKIDIYNLARGGDIVGDEVEIWAGYKEGGFGIIAKGDIRSISSRRAGQEVITTITAGDGDRAVMNGFTNKTLDKNSTVKDVISVCAGGMGIQTGQIKGCDTKLDTTHKTICGHSKKELNKLKKRACIDWWIEKKELVSLHKMQVFEKRIEANVNTGMIGSPRATEDGINVDMLLNHDVRIGQLLHVVSDDINREYKIISYSHSGDFYGNSWKTTIIGKSKDRLSCEDARGVRR